MLSNRLNKPYWMLRLFFGVVPIVAGLDKFTNVLTRWDQYLSPWVSAVVPATTFMHMVGVIEIAAGAIVLSRFTRAGAYVVALWLVGIAVNLLTTGHFLDVAVRDLVMAAAAFTLGRLEEVRVGSFATRRSAAPLGAQPAAVGHGTLASTREAHR